MEYNWDFIGSDIGKESIQSAQSICDGNKELKKHIDLRIQSNPKRFFENILQPSDRVVFSMCNPPFHKSAKEANDGTLRKLKNLQNTKTPEQVLNFGGSNSELWCKGGEFQFVKNLIQESAQFAKNCSWFTTLISKKETLKHMLVELEKVGETTVKIIELKTGNKISRVLCWRFLNKQ